MEVGEEADDILGDLPKDSRGITQIAHNSEFSIFARALPKRPVRPRAGSAEAAPNPRHVGTTAQALFEVRQRGRCVAARPLTNQQNVKQATNGPSPGCRVISSPLHAIRWSCPVAVHNLPRCLR